MTRKDIDSIDFRGRDLIEFMRGKREQIEPELLEWWDRWIAATIRKEENFAKVMQLGIKLDRGSGGEMTPEYRQLLTKQESLANEDFKAYDRYRLERKKLRERHRERDSHLTSSLATILSESLTDNLEGFVLGSATLGELQAILEPHAATVSMGFPPYCEDCEF